MLNESEAICSTRIIDTFRKASEKQEIEGKKCRGQRRDTQFLMRKEFSASAVSKQC
jgi:hypothetical protein